MFFGKINIPDELLEAQETGDLVIFAGAGVSVPSGIQTFKYIFSEKIIELEFDSELNYEELTAQLCKKGVKVHKRYASYLKDGSFKPNSYHYSILKLFIENNPTQIITTNYDNLFSLAEHELKIYEYEPSKYPHLPNDCEYFDRITHIHGSIENDSKYLIITEDDFSEAYMRNIVMIMFLKSVFEKKTVLFIGFSHEDKIWKHLSKAYKGSNRYIFLTEEKKETLDKFNFKVIPYDRSKSSSRTNEEEQNDEHLYLKQSLEAWAIYSGKDKEERDSVRRKVYDKKTKAKSKIITSILEDKSQFIEISQTNTPSDKQVKFVLSKLFKLSTVRLFGKHFKSPLWLRILYENGVLNNLFNNSIELDDKEIELAEWLSQNFVIDNHIELFSIIKDSDHSLNSALWHRIIWVLTHGKERPSEEMMNQWLLVLFNCVPSDYSVGHSIEYLLNALQKDKYSKATVFVFNCLLDTKVKIETSIIVKLQQDKDILELKNYIDGYEYFISSVWLQFFKPNLEITWQLLLPSLESKLSKLYLSKSLIENKTEFFDSFSYGRSAIKTHEQDKYRKPLDNIIDSLRDILDYLIEHEPKIAKLYIEKWLISDFILFKRLALYGLSKSTKYSANFKIKLLIKTKLVFDSFCKYEVYQVLKIAFSEADDKTQKKMVSYIEGYQK